MSRAGITIKEAALAVIITLVLLSGCTTTPAENNSTNFPTSTSLPTTVPTASTVQVSGQALFMEEAATGAPVWALALDGTDNASTYADQNGTYRLNLKRGVPYKVTASYMGYQHTIWPVYAYSSKYDRLNGFDINLTTQPKSTVEGYVTIHHILVELTPQNGGPAISTTNGYNKTYSLEVEPDTPYYISGRDYYNQTQFHIRFLGPNSYNIIEVTESGYYVHDRPIVVGNNETALVDVNAMWLI